MNSDIFQILRPKQWIKNVLLFAPLIFSQNFFVAEKFLVELYAFGAFCLLASTGYVINDLRDYREDRKHPIKRKRPIASGALSIKNAYVLLALLLVGSLSLSYWIDLKLFMIGFIYLALNIAYSLFFKHMVIIDVMVLASFYVIRVWAGAEVIQVPLTPWLTISIMLLALFLGFGKRRHELTQLGDKASYHRAILKEYSPYLLDQMIAVVTSATIIVYTFYTLDEQVVAQLGTDQLPFTIPFVLYGIFRYLYLIHHKQKGGSPTQTVLTDIPLLVNGIIWTGLVLYLIS